MRIGHDTFGRERKREKRLRDFLKGILARDGDGVNLEREGWRDFLEGNFFYLI